MLFQKRDCLSAFTSQMLFTIINIRMNHEKRGCAYLSQRVSGSHGFVLSASLVRLHLYDVCLFFFFIFFFLSFERIQKQYFSPFCIESIFITCINLSFFFQPVLHMSSKISLTYILNDKQGNNTKEIIIIISIDKKYKNGKRRKKSYTQIKKLSNLELIHEICISYS